MKLPWCLYGLRLRQWLWRNWKLRVWLCDRTFFGRVWIGAKCSRLLVFNNFADWRVWVRWRVCLWPGIAFLHDCPEYARGQVLPKRLHKWDGSGMKGPIPALKGVCRGVGRVPPLTRPIPDDNLTWGCYRVWHVV